ncbi:MAG: hypothetical protein PHI35_02585 [Victivallaceae bacterium]|nr:hypothetical protein [Victivallaceae bacterium]
MANRKITKAKKNINSSRQPVARAGAPADPPSNSSAPPRFYIDAAITRIFTRPTACKIAQEGLFYYLTGKNRNDNCMVLSSYMFCCFFLPIALFWYHASAHRRKKPVMTASSYFLND